MSNTTYVILGNGFSIGLIDLLHKGDKIDLRNLFTKGDEVVWPDTQEKGFLSRKYCKNLWTLGARTTMTAIEANKFIGDIITCLNVFNFAAFNNESLTNFRSSDNIYISAHNELSTYLKNLFIYYNSLVSDSEIENIIDDISLINYISELYDHGQDIVIITYNYDIFLERLLKIKSIPFSVCGFNKRSRAKIKIIKPHGSISFVSKIKPIPNKNFEIKSTFDSVVTDINDLKLDYYLRGDDSLVNAIIPPAGDSNRLNKGWVRDIREILKKEIMKAKEKETLIIYGLSYDHVDRIEIDEIVTTVNSEVNVKYINPDLSTTFDTVLSSIFNNYIHLKKCDF
jgi:hypothetical protein